MVIDIEILNKVKAQLRWGDQAEIAKRLGLSRNSVSLKFRGKSPISNEEAKVISQVVKDRLAKENKIKRTLNPIINE